MTVIKKFAAVAIASFTLAVAVAPSAEARPWRRHHGGAVAAGLFGAALLGTAVLASRPAYAAPVAYADDEECYRKRVGTTHYGRPIFRTVCY